MRQLYRRLGDEEDSICLAYMGAERDAEVERPRGAEHVTPGTHARALWLDGKLNGWLTS